MLTFLTLFFLKNPLILIPPLGGSQLLGTAKNFDTHWYCFKNFENTLLWIHSDLFIPPLINCLADYFTCEWNETLKKPTSSKNIKIDTYDFGGDKGTRFVDNGIFGFKFGSVFDKIFKKFENNGYKIKENIFSAPYDWRMNPVSMDDYFYSLKNLIENAYNKNMNSKVILYGMSAGTMTLHEFLIKYVSKEWKKKYIKNSIFHVPSFTGSLEAFDALWSGNIALMPSFLESLEMKKMIKSIPTISAHLYKSKVYQDDIFVYGPKGETYKASDLPKLLKDHYKIPENLSKIFEFSSKYSTEPLLDPDVPVYLLYNTKIKTPKALKFNSNWNNYEIIYSKGDGTVLSKSFEYPCDNWNTDKGLICHDIDIDDDQYNHSNQLQNEEVLNIILKIVQDDSWIKPGKKIIKGL